MPKYQNVDPLVPGHRTVRNVLKWRLGLGPEPLRRAPNKAPVPVLANDGVALRGARRDSLTWIGHATYLLQLGGMSVLTDPILSPSLGGVLARNVAPGLGFDALPPVDIVTVSHNHRDHMDVPTLLRLPRSATVVVPAGLGRWFKRQGFQRVHELEWWESVGVGNLELTLVPAQHWSRRGLFDEDATLWGGFVYRYQNTRAYHSGDTAYFSGFRAIGERVGPIDAAMLPIGAYEPRWFMRAQHMNPDDAMQAFEDLRAARFFAMHWGTFKLTDEPLDEPPARVDALWSATDWDRSRLFIPAIGETLEL